MGTPIGRPVDSAFVPASNACTVCWGIGKPFGDVATPLNLTVSISGINKAITWTPAMGEPVNGVFNVEQPVGGFCQWRYSGVDAEVALIYAIGASNIEVRNELGVVVFLALETDDCLVEFVNLITFGFTGGTIVVTINEVI